MKSRLTYRIYGIVLASALTVSADSQPHLRESEIYIGVHGGILASTVFFQPSMSNTVMHFSGNGGAVFRFNNRRYCGFQAELNYMQRGWHERISSTNSMTGSSGTYYRRLDYLELPVLMHLYVGNEHWRGFLNAGPHVGYLVHELSEGAMSKSPTAQYAPVSYPFDWGIAAGLGCVCIGIEPRSRMTERLIRPVREAASHATPCLASAPFRRMACPRPGLRRLREAFPFLCLHNLN